MKSSFRVILLSSIIPVIIIGYLTSPAMSPGSHWAAVAWIIVLIFANWHLSSILIADGTDKSLFGVLPAAGLVLTIGSLVSAILIIFASRSFSIQEPWHLIAQVIVIFGTVFLLALFNLTRHIASNSVAKSYIGKKRVIEKIKILLLKTKDGNYDRIISIINFDFPHDAKLQYDKDWLSFSLNP